MKRSRFVILIVLGVLILDQALKIWIKTHLTYGEEFGLLGLDWARIHFVENEGMAFGISFGGEFGKLALSLFRLVAVGFLIYIIHALVKAGESKGLLLCFALILAGAIGNIVDSAFYGLIFTESTYHSVAEMFPEGGGYASFLHGRVVDMLYFPLIDTTLPDWFPIWGGKRFEFFKPVFNIADSAISVGVISMLVFHRRFLRTGQSSVTAAASGASNGSDEEE
ncbi:MAG: lipoprotein signal peptidase [Saprospiraceae bacterium]|nr:lipoprotein signal peptidase [Saprospiraceae bacterium]